MGYGFHPAIIEAPDQQSNLIDSPTHTISMGGGYRTQNDTLAFHTDFFVATHVMQPSQVNKNATNESYAFGGIAISSGLNAGLDF